METETLMVKRLSDGFIETLRVTLPALLTVTSGLAAVKDLPLGSLERAFSEADVVCWGAKDLALREDEVGLLGSATRVWGLRPPPPRKKGEILSGSARELVGHLLRKLEALSIVDEEDVSNG
jgi:electron transfer flavoprotein alpha/beta subunit